MSTFAVAPVKCTVEMSPSLLIAFIMVCCRNATQRDVPDTARQGHNQFNTPQASTFSKWESKHAGQRKAMN